MTNDKPLLATPRPDTTALVRLFSGSVLFSGFPPSALAKLAEGAVMRSACDKEVIFEKGDPGDELFALVHGRVKISASSENGKEVIFAILESGDFFGETALLDGKPRCAGCVAIEDCQLLVVKREKFLSLLEQTPSLAIHLLTLVCERLRQADRYLEEISFFPLEVRLARRLLTLADEYGSPANGGIEIALNISQHELGSMVAASRESVNVALNQWVKEGWLTLGRGVMTIHARESLCQIARIPALQTAR